MKTIEEIITFINEDYFYVQLIVFFVVLVVLFLMGRIIRGTISRFIRKRTTEKQEVHAAFLEAVGASATAVLLGLGIYFGLKFIDFPEENQEMVATIASIVMVITLGYFVYKMVDVPSIWFESLVSKSEKPMNKMFLPVIRKSMQIVVLSLIILQVVQVISDKPIATIIEGLGIGGLAVALAAQDTLKHFIGSFVLAGDKPFEIGDRVVVDGHDGPVEEMGLRSTRIRTLDGHLVSVPNGELANRTIQNIGKRPYIRRVANITITYDTPPEKVNRAVEILKELLDNHEGMDPEFPPRVFFSEFNADSLNILMIYWYHPPEYWQYLEFTEKLNFQILQRFNDEGIDFAFPTQTLHVAGDPKRPFKVDLEQKGHSG
ncbi:MAG: mechanosensitive ion channel family protein [Bacteroidota bacterium]